MSEENVPFGRARAVEIIRKALEVAHGMTSDQADDLIKKANEIDLITAMREDLKRQFAEAVRMAERCADETDPEDFVSQADREAVYWESGANDQIDTALYFLIVADSRPIDQFWEQAEEVVKDEVMDALREKGLLPKKCKRCGLIPTPPPGVCPGWPRDQQCET